MALDSLDERIVLRVPKFDFSGRIARDDGFVWQAFDRPHKNLLGTPTRTPAQRYRPQQLSIPNIEHPDRTVRISGSDDVAVLESDAEDSGSFRRGPHDPQKLQVTVRGRQDDDGSVRATSGEMLAGKFPFGGREGFPVLALGRLPPGLRCKTPDLAVVAARMAGGESLLEIPLRDRVRVSDAEEAEAAWDLAPTAIGVVLSGVHRPRQSFDAAILSPAQDRLLEPGAAQGVPDLDIAIGTADREPERLDTSSSEISGWGVRERKGIDSLRVVGDEAAAVDIHGGQK